MRGPLTWVWMAALVLGLTPWAWGGTSGLTLGEPTQQKLPNPSTGGLGLGPARPPTPAPNDAGGLSLTLQPAGKVPPRPDLPPLPPLPTIPPFRPPPSPPVPAAGQPCDCLKWDYTPDPALTFFQISVSATAGTYTASHVRAIIPAIPELITEYPCEALLLSGPGPYYAVVQAVGRDPSMTSDSSEDVCLVVVHRKVYGCVGEGVTVGECRGQVARGP
jgi:hypothetical protein